MFGRQKLCVTVPDATEEPDGSVFCTLVGGGKVSPGDVVTLMKREDWQYWLSHQNEPADPDSAWLGRVVRVEGRPRRGSSFYCYVRPMERFGDF